MRTGDEEGPIRVVDKRLEKRLAAEAARLDAEAAEAAAADRAAAESTPEDPELTAAREELERLSARRTRIQQMRDAGREDDYLSDAEREELLSLQAEEQAYREAHPEVEVASVRTAFLVTVDHDGRVMATPDTNLALEMHHEAGTDEMYTACSLVLRDIQAAATAQQVVFGLQVSAQAMAEKQQAVAMAQRMGRHPGAQR